MEFILTDDDHVRSNPKLPSDSSGLSKYMSESVRSEINDMQYQMINEREVQETRRANHEGFHMRLADHDGTRQACFNNASDPAV